MQDLFLLLPQTSVTRCSSAFCGTLWLWYYVYNAWLDDKIRTKQECGVGKILLMVFAKLFNNTDEYLYLLYLTEIS